jgi:hypothetical protein
LPRERVHRTHYSPMYVSDNTRRKFAYLKSLSLDPTLEFQIPEHSNKFFPETHLNVILPYSSLEIEPAGSNAVI